VQNVIVDAGDANEVAGSGSGQRAAGSSPQLPDDCSCLLLLKQGDTYETAMAGWCGDAARGRRTVVGQERGAREGRGAARRRTRGRGAGARLKLTSSGFTDGGAYPLDFTCYATAEQPEPSAVNPPFSWTNVPRGTQSFVLALNGTDNHAEQGIDMEMFWVVYTSPRPRRRLRRSEPGDRPTAAPGDRARNIAGYRAPCAPVGVGRLHTCSRYSRWIRC